jgi:hypothetical protein
MVVDVIHINGVIALETEDHAPIAADVHGPRAFRSTLQRMQTEPGQVHIPRLGRRVESGEDKPKAARVLWPNATSISGFKEGSQTLVPPPSDHDPM